MYPILICSVNDMEFIFCDVSIIAGVVVESTVLAVLTVTSRCRDIILANQFLSARPATSILKHLLRHQLRTLINYLIRPSCSTVDLLLPIAVNSLNVCWLVDFIVVAVSYYPNKS